jgi:uncharacterized cupredoxin-like copper-binding protein
MTIFREIQPRTLLAAAAFGAAVALPTALWSAGDLSKQTPVEVTVDLGKPGEHVFAPREIRLETGKLYKLILRNPSEEPHYFTSDAFSAMIFTRKVQVTQQRDGKSTSVAEFKGAIREIEVFPGHAAEWWFVPVAAGRVADLRCGIVAKDGKTHAQLGMTGEIVIE